MTYNEDNEEEGADDGLHYEVKSDREAEDDEEESKGAHRGHMT